MPAGRLPPRALQLLRDADSYARFDAFLYREQLRHGQGSPKRLTELDAISADASDRLSRFMVSGNARLRQASRAEKLAAPVQEHPPVAPV